MNLVVGIIGILLATLAAAVLYSLWCSWIPESNRKRLYIQLSVRGYQLAMWPALWFGMSGIFRFIRDQIEPKDDFLLFFVGVVGFFGSVAASSVFAEEWLQSRLKKIKPA